MSLSLEDQLFGAGLVIFVGSPENYRAVRSIPLTPFQLRKASNHPLTSPLRVDRVPGVDPHFCDTRESIPSLIWRVSQKGRPFVLYHNSGKECCFFLLFSPSPGTGLKPGLCKRKTHLSHQSAAIGSKPADKSLQNRLLEGGLVILTTSRFTYVK